MHNQGRCWCAYSPPTTLQIYKYIISHLAKSTNPKVLPEHILTNLYRWLLHDLDDIIMPAPFFWLWGDGRRPIYIFLLDDQLNQQPWDLHALLYIPANSVLLFFF
jgi:hypothetical protein